MIYFQFLTFLLHRDEIQRLVNVINQITTEKDLDSIEQQLPINSYSPSKKLASPNKRPLSVNHSVSNKNNKSVINLFFFNILIDIF